MAAMEDIAHFQFYAHFVSVDPAKNRRRFYAIIWQPALWDGEALVRSWGRIGTAGRRLSTHYPDRESAKEAVEKMVARRLKRGYTLVDFE